MRINERTEIHGDKVVLVPYDVHLVPKYHNWMQSEELLETTASERLTLEEEYEMQKSWRRDNDKLTFIVLDKRKLQEGGEEEAMIGDTNLFLGDDTAEVMIMIAETSYRRQGYGREALLLILRYGVEALKLEKYQVKISTTNSPSIALFKKIGFQVESENAVFSEVTLSKTVDTEWTTWLTNNGLSTYEEKER